MPLTRGEAVGYDADLMAFKFTMRNGRQIVQCEISNTALGDLAGRWRRRERDVPAEFEAHPQAYRNCSVHGSTKYQQGKNRFGPHFCEPHFDSAART